MTVQEKSPFLKMQPAEPLRVVTVSIDPRRHPPFTAADIETDPPAIKADLANQMETMMMIWAIEKDGYFFRAVNGEFRSAPFASPSQAGSFIQRKAGKEAHAAAAAAFIGTAN